MDSDKLAVQMTHEMSRVSLEKAGGFVHSKKEYYLLMEIKGYVMPKIKSAVITNEILNDIQNKVRWVPMQEELKIRKIRWEVTKAELIEEIGKECLSKGLSKWSFHFYRISIFWSSSIFWR